MVLFILLAAATLVPSLLLVTYFHRRDVYPEPPAVLWRTFGWGVLIVFPVCLVAWPMDALAAQLGHPLLYGFASAFFGAAIPEEIFKFAVVYFYAARHIQFDEPMDGIVYGATASLGFATLENVLYVSDGGLPVAITRAFLAVPGHAFLGAIMGYYIGRAKFTDGDRRPLLVRALAIPILLHGLYDGPLLAGNGGGSDPGCFFLALLPMVLAIVVVEAVWATRLVRRMRTEQLAAGCPPAPPAQVAGTPAAATPVAATPVVVPAPGTLAATPPASEPGRPRQGGRWASWLLILFGGLFACGGALVTLGLVLTLVEGGSSSEGPLYDAIAGVVLGLLPLVAGTFGFFRGIRRLNRPA